MDKPVSIPVPGGQIWEPRNHNNQYIGVATLRQGIARSLNTVAAQLIMDVGVDTVIDYAERMGITTFVKTGAYNDRTRHSPGRSDRGSPSDMAVAEF